MDPVDASLKTLDRYLLREWLRILLLAELGFPLVVIIIDITDKLGSYLARGLTRGAVALSYLYYLPEIMFLVLPAAVLFATVFTVGPLARHSELTAAKASGMSFHRLVRPLFVAAAAVVLFGIIIGDVARGVAAGRSHGRPSERCGEASCSASGRSTPPASATTSCTAPTAAGCTRSARSTREPGRCRT